MILLAFYSCWHLIRCLLLANRNNALKKGQKNERIFSRLLSPDLEYCFILDAGNVHNISDLVLLTSYWKLIKRARDIDLAQQKGAITEEKQDEIRKQNLFEDSR